MGPMEPTLHVEPTGFGNRVERLHVSKVREGGPVEATVEAPKVAVVTMATEVAKETMTRAGKI